MYRLVYRSRRTGLSGQLPIPRRTSPLPRDYTERSGVGRGELFVHEHPFQETSVLIGGWVGALGGRTVSRQITKAHLLMKISSFPWLLSPTIAHTFQRTNNGAWRSIEIETSRKQKAWQDNHKDTNNPHPNGECFVYFANGNSHVSRINT